MTEETKTKMSLSAIARGVKPPSRKGARHTLETRLKMSRAKTKHGKTPLRQTIRMSDENRHWRKSVFERDNYTCVKCGIKSAKGVVVYLQADHFPQTFASIISNYQINTMQDARDCPKLWDINNGRTLCTPCHLCETSKLYVNV